MKEAVENGEAFAVAHYNYAKSLNDMGFALRNFAHFEVLNLKSSSDHQHRPREHDMVDSGDGAGASTSTPLPWDFWNFDHETNYYYLQRERRRRQRERERERTFDLSKVFPDLNSHFEKASESAMVVWKTSGLLVDKRGHSSNSGFGELMRSFSHSFRRSRPDDNALIPRDDFNLEENEIRPPVLDSMFEWENRLYDRVKAHEHMQVEYHKQLYILNKLKREKTDLATFKKKKELVTNLHKDYDVEEKDMKSAIERVNMFRDEELFRKLFQLVQGMATMWQTMKNQHENQLNIATMLKDNMKLSPSKTETTEQHHKSTNMLLETVKKWDRQYSKLVESQKAFIKALEKWLELSVIPFAVGLDGKVFFPTSVEHPPIERLLSLWKNKLGVEKKLTVEIARTPIRDFAQIIDDIMELQSSEMKEKKEYLDSLKDLEKKQQQCDSGYFDGARMVESAKRRLKEEQESYEKRCEEVRNKSLEYLKTSLPKLFRDMGGIAINFSDMYRELIGSMNM
ncbi:hypothetical protein PTKIN_Ptkin04bG0227100 [Pterospermum kingtungense]